MPSTNKKALPGKARKNLARAEAKVEFLPLDATSLCVVIICDGLLSRQLTCFGNDRDSQWRHASALAVLILQLNRVFPCGEFLLA